jgi:hypothetical protein
VEEDEAATMSRKSTMPSSSLSSTASTSCSATAALVLACDEDGCAVEAAVAAVREDAAVTTPLPRCFFFRLSPGDTLPSLCSSSLRRFEPRRAALELEEAGGASEVAFVFAAAAVAAAAEAAILFLRGTNLLVGSSLISALVNPLLFTSPMRSPKANSCS